MMRVRRIHLALGAIAALLMTNGCTDESQGQKLTAAQWATVAGPDLNCPGSAQVRPGRSPQYYDIDGDGSAEIFVDFICAGTDPTTARDQVEVFGGTSRASRIVRITTVWDGPNQLLFLAHGCIYFTGNTVVIIGRMHRSGDLAGPPSALFSLTSAWNKKTHKIDVGQAISVSNTGSVPPGCI
jgi:hypothetical protein